MKSPAAFLAFLLCISALDRSLAVTITVGASADTWILGEDGYKDHNMGASDTFATGINAHGSPMRGLIKFNLSAIPTNATITSATLTMTAIQANLSPGVTTFTLHRVLQPWGEGARVGNTGSPADPGEATWLARIHSTSAWSSPGAASPSDFTATQSASTLVSTNGPYTWGSTANMIADVQAWVNNTNNNHGWLFKDQAESNLSARRWSSREGGSGPSLVINYSPPAQGPSISSVIRTNNQVRFAFNASANIAYTVEARPLVSTGSWTPITNFSSVGFATNRVVTDTIAGTAKFYRVKAP